MTESLQLLSLLAAFTRRMSFRLAYSHAGFNGCELSQLSEVSDFPAGRPCIVTPYELEGETVTTGCENLVGVQGRRTHNGNHALHVVYCIGGVRTEGTVTSLSSKRGMSTPVVYALSSPGLIRGSDNRDLFDCR